MKNIFALSFALLMLSFFSCKDDDMTGGGTTSTDPTISISSVSKFEGDVNSNFEFKVRLSKSSDETITVDYTTNDLAAVSGEDYISQNGRLTFLPSETEQSILVEIVADTLKEGDEDFEVKLSNATNATFDKDSEVGIIRNDDTFLVGGTDGYTTPLSYAGLTLSWQDEFDGPNIDQGCWTHELGNSGWGNNELQNYTASSENSYISDGKLIIEARKESSGGAEYSSARMITAGKKEFTFGRVDIRAKLPEGQGIWPALWMLGANIFTVGWPHCGEIDIMELVGHEPHITHGTGHWGPAGSNSSTFEGGDYVLAGGAKFSDEYHVFSIIWENNNIKYYVDDNLYFTLTQSMVGADYNFNNNFFFIFNIAVGGNWPGNPNATTVFPQRMYVDYIRVFQ